MNVIADVFANTLARNRSEDGLVDGQDRAFEADERFRLAIESFPTAVILTDGNGTMIRLNSRTTMTFGYHEEELLGQPIEMLMPHPFRGVYQGNWAEFAIQPGMRPMGTGQALFGLRKDGSQFQVEIALSPMSTQDGMLVLSAITDVSDCKLSEDSPIESNARKYTARAQIRSMKDDLEREYASFQNEIKLELDHTEIA